MSPFDEEKPDWVRFRMTSTEVEGDICFANNEDPSR